MDRLDTMIILLYGLIGSLVFGLWKINALIRKGFNEVIEGLQSIDTHLNKQ